jgi:hypothetical protein
MEWAAKYSRTRAATFGGFPLKPNDHLCVFFRGRAERDELLIPFLLEGLRAGHACAFYAAEGETEHIPELLRTGNSYVHYDPSLLVVREPEDGHLRGGAFAPDALLAGLRAWSAESFATPGVACARAIADMSWANPILSPQLVGDLVRSEVKVARWVRSGDQIAVCLYDLELFGGDLLVPMIKAHRKVWMGGTLVENPYYIDPDFTDDHRSHH